MVKPMVMSIEVEEIAFGRVFRTLDTMKGVIAIHLKGTGPKKAGPTGARGPRGSSATVECLILGALIAAKAPVPKVDLVAAATAGGKQASSVPDALNKLKNKKHVHAVSAGRFKITPAGKSRFQTACSITQEK